MKTIQEAKEIIERLYPMQEKKKHNFPCPRCGHMRMHIEKPVLNAFSRRANVYICEACGMDEAMRDALGIPPIPLNEWALPLCIDELEESGMLRKPWES